MAKNRARASSLAHCSAIFCVFVSIMWHIALFWGAPGDNRHDTSAELFSARAQEGEQCGIFQGKIVCYPGGDSYF